MKFPVIACPADWKQYIESLQSFTRLNIKIQNKFIEIKYSIIICYIGNK